MNIRSAFIGFSAALLVVIISAFSQQQDCPKIDRKGLRNLLVTAGYTIKDLNTTEGQEKYELTIRKDGLDIPIAIEITPSTNYIWFTVNLGPAPGDGDLQHAQLLKQNGMIQPSQFYISSSGKLMIGLPVENKSVTIASLIRNMDTITGKVTETKSYWMH